MEKSLTDLELVRKYVETNNDVYFNVLYNKYKKLVIHEIRKYTKDPNDIDELSQEVWTSALCSFHRYSGDGMQYWLCTISRNKFMDKMRKLKRKPIVYCNEFYDLECDGYDLSEIKEKERMIDKMIACTDTLEGTQRIVVKLRLLGKKYVDISRITSIPIGTCQPANKIAVRKLRKLLI